MQTPDNNSGIISQDQSKTPKRNSLKPTGEKLTSPGYPNTVESHRKLLPEELKQSERNLSAGGGTLIDGYRTH